MYCCISINIYKMQREFITFYMLTLVRHVPLPWCNRAIYMNGTGGRRTFCDLYVLRPGNRRVYVSSESLAFLAPVAHIGCFLCECT